MSNVKLKLSKFACSLVWVQEDFQSFRHAGISTDHLKVKKLLQHSYYTQYIDNKRNRSSLRLRNGILNVLVHLVQNHGQCKDGRLVYAWVDPCSVDVPPETEQLHTCVICTTIDREIRGSTGPLH